MARRWYAWVGMAVVLAGGCGLGDDLLPDIEERGLLLGVVHDTNGWPLADVTVRALDRSAISNSDGYFSIADAPATDRVVVRFAKADYVPVSVVTQVRGGEASYVTAVLAPLGLEATVSASSGGTVSAGGASVTLPANGIVTETGATYTGTVHVALTPFDPSTAAGLAAFPGSFEGVRLDGTTVPIESFGFVDVTLTDPNGAALRLGSGKTATLSLTVPAALLSRAPATIPLWYFDSIEGRWLEEGSATLSGSIYTGTVSHFTVWNADMPRETSWVRGRVVDGRGPVRGAHVTVKGANWQSGESSTSEDGTFRIPVGSDRSCTLVAGKNGVESDPRVFVSAAAGGEYDIGDISLEVPMIKIALTWGEQPADLDSHLTIPLTGSERAHLYYSQTSIADAVLDTDDRDGKGPEIVTVHTLHDGVYRYAVHHFSGEGTISTSGAAITMVVDRLGLYHLTPPSGAVGDDDAWLAWDIVVSGGRVTAVQTIDQFKAGVSSGDTAAFSP